MEEPQSITQETEGRQQYLSRQERRRQMRSGTSSGMRSGMMRRLLFWGGGLLVLVLVGWGMMRLSDSVVIPSGNGVLSDPISDADHSWGPIDAGVTLVEYSDFQCPACGAYYPLVKRVLAEDGIKDRVRFVYRSFPLTNIHLNADLAARAAEAAAQQGKFWEMHDALFESQKTWAGFSATGAREAFRGYAKTIGMNESTFLADLDSSVVKNIVREQVAGATRAGVNSTPTFFINGKQIAQPSSYDEFRKFILDAVNANP